MDGVNDDGHPRQLCGNASQYTRFRAVRVHQGVFLPFHNSKQFPERDDVVEDLDLPGEFIHKYEVQILDLFGPFAPFTFGGTEEADLVFLSVQLFNGEECVVLCTAHRQIGDDV